MRKYYINELNEPKYFSSDWDHRALGLFSESIFPFLPHWKGYGNVEEGNGTEYYTYCKLLAYGIQYCDGFQMYDTHRKFETVTTIKKFHFIFFDENDKNAIELFKQQKYNDKHDLGKK